MCADVLASTGRLKFDDQMLLDTLSKRLLQGIPSLSPSELVDAVSHAAGYHALFLLFDLARRQRWLVRLQATCMSACHGIAQLLSCPAACRWRGCRAQITRLAR